MNYIAVQTNYYLFFSNHILIINIVTLESNFRNVRVILISNTHLSTFKGTHFIVNSIYWYNNI